MNCVKVEKGIFIGGGLDSINSKASKDVYLYNVDDKRVQTLAPMEESRYGFGIAYLHGYVYIFGGFTKSITRKVSIYDMLNNEWKEGDEITKGRSMMKTLVLGDDKILLFGGKEGNSRSGLV